MAGGKLWTPEEDALIRKMVMEGATLQAISDALPDRTVQAVDKRISRLQLHRRQTMKIFFPTIPVKKIIKRKEALKMLAGVAEMLQQGGGMEREEMNRIRTLNAVLRNYFMILNTYDKFEKLDDWVKKVDDKIKTLEKIYTNRGQSPEHRKAT